MLKAFLKYRKSAVNAHGIHSPFVFEFYNEVLTKSKNIDDSAIQNFRKKLSKDTNLIEITDLGAGSRKPTANKRNVSDLVKHVSVSRKYGRLLTQIIKYYGIDNCLEMGTSMGIGTAYLSSNAQRTVTIEGCPNTYKQATQNLQSLNLKGLSMLNAEFSEGLKKAYEIESNYGLVYIDGNHQYQATLDYFNWIIDRANNDTFLIFDDINWSAGMRQAWDEIVSSEKINVSIELFRMGIVLKRKEQTKQHFILKF